MKIPPCNRILLLGGGDLLLRVAENAKRDGFDVQVLTAPRHAEERPVGGVTFLESLARIGVRCEVVSALSAEALAARQPAVGLSFGAAWRFKRPVIDAFEGRLFNVHSARLPNDRGAGGYSWQILRDNRFGYCLIHQIDEGLDSGPVAAFEEYLHAPGCRVPADYFAEATARNEGFIDRFLAKLRHGAELTLQPQNETLALYWPRLSAIEQGYIDWNWDAESLERFICAFDRPYVGAGTFVGGDEVRLRDAWLSREEHGFHPFQAGIVFRVSSLGIHVAARDGSLLVRDVRARDGSEMLDRIRPGDRLMTPSTVLDRALAYRAVYTPAGPRAEGS